MVANADSSPARTRATSRSSVVPSGGGAATATGSVCAVDGHVLGQTSPEVSDLTAPRASQPGVLPPISVRGSPPCTWPSCGAGGVNADPPRRLAARRHDRECGALTLIRQTLPRPCQGLA